MISMAITTYNRYQMTIDCFAQIIDHPFISEFVILDDASTDDSFGKLRKHFISNDKVQLWRNQQNVGMGHNKHIALLKCKEDFSLIADSDNIFTNESIDALVNIDFRHDTIYCPDFAKINFDYRKFGGKTFDKDNIKELLIDSMGNCLANTCNYVVPSENYFNTYIRNDEMKATDTIWFLYLWIKAGYKIEVVKGFEYFHTVHAGSGFMEDVNYNLKKGEEVKLKIMAL